MPATEQYTKIKCCVLLLKSPSETLQMLEEVYGKTVKKMQAYEWHKLFVKTVLASIMIYDACDRQC
jgi:hypothetical protein